MSNDLISRDAVIKSIQNKFNEFDFDTEYHEGLRDGYLNAIYAIEDAPTVEPCKDCEDKRQAEYIRHGSSWHELQALRKFKEEHERLQGEWIDVNGDGSLWKCNNCGEKSCCKGKYCPDCGALMIGGTK